MKELIISSSDCVLRVIKFLKDNVEEKIIKKKKKERKKPRIFSLKTWKGKHLAWIGAFKSLSLMGKELPSQVSVISVFGDPINLMFTRLIKTFLRNNCIRR